MASHPLVGIVMGSASDWETMKHAADTLERLGIAYERKVASAHRTPDRVIAYSRGARERGLKVIIAAAGLAAGLPGMVAALTPLPVLGVPLAGGLMGGLDSLLSMSQMPGGVPVGTLAVGRHGAINAAVLAASILALGDAQIAASLDAFRKAQSDAVPEDPEAKR
ncbi:MAG TPA: 5-(carboxyamino)imidazole ribonucleotide mutase [Stellaceae bacterium]|nr:5-(carboxyamino)imidazole ribonucleotide mutase [Stellaceae bacterium]